MILYFIKNQIRRLLLRFKKTELKVVYDKDLSELLKSLGILDKVKQGKFRCVHCGETITLHNLGVLFRKKGVIYIVCSKKECLATNI